MKAWSLSATISSIGLFTFSEPSILGLKFFVPGALVCNDLLSPASAAIPVSA
jgi:hypothetical protein